jgi:hypothetical protein
MVTSCRCDLDLYRLILRRHALRWNLTDAIDFAYSGVTPTLATASIPKFLY